MIPKVDSYIYETLNKYVPAVINSTGTPNERYIIDEVLEGFEPQTADKFKQAFTRLNPDKKDIDVRYTFPKLKEQIDGAYVISKGGTQPNASYIGLTTGVHTDARPNKGENTQTDYLPVQVDDDGYFVELTKPVYSLLSIEELTEDTYVDYQRDDPDPLRLNLTPVAKNILGSSITVTYTVKDDGFRKDYGGTDVGFTAEDTVIIQSVSNNIDTVRCLDALLRYIMIVARSSARESEFYQLQTFGSDDGLSVVDMGLDNPVYVISLKATYKVTYALTYDSQAKLEKIILNGKDINND